MRLGCFFLLLVAVIFMGAGPAFSMDGVFDRSNEVETYLRIVQSGSRGDVIRASHLIYASGISDARLAAAVNERLVREYPRLQEDNRVRVVTYNRAIVTRYLPEGNGAYGLAMIRALTSFGIPEYAETLEKISRTPKQGGAPSKRMRKSAKLSIAEIDWHRHKNEIMASRIHHTETDDPVASRLLNMLLSDESRDRDFAMDTMLELHIKDDRLFAEINRRVQEYVKHAPSKTTKKDDGWAVKAIRCLGTSGDKTYVATLDAFNSSNASPALKKRARIALGYLPDDRDDRDDQDDR